MTEWYLIRHGAREPGPGDVPLTAVGRADARRTADWLASQPLSAVYASPLRRARETAEILAGRAGLPVQVDPRLRERAGWGDRAGQRTFRLWDLPSRPQPIRPAGGRAADEAEGGLRGFLLEESGRHPQTLCAAVTHGGVLADLFFVVLSREDRERFGVDGGSGRGLQAPECSVTRVRCENGRFELLGWASVDHLR